MQACPESQRDSYSIFLSDLLHPSLGTLASSLQVHTHYSSSSTSSSSTQINFMVELDFLTMCYEVHGVQGLPLVILHGEYSLLTSSPPPLPSSPPHPQGARALSWPHPPAMCGRCG